MYGSVECFYHNGALWEPGCYYVQAAAVADAGDKSFIKGFGKRFIGPVHFVFLYQEKMDGTVGYRPLVNILCLNLCERLLLSVEHSCKRGKLTKPLRLSALS